MSWNRRLRQLDKASIAEQEKLALGKVSDLASVPSYSFAGSVHTARVSRVIDGDTVVVVMILHGGAPRSFSVRLLGIDTPEMKPLKSNKDRDAIKREALAARDALQALLPLGSFCTVECGPFCKFGRILGTLFNEQKVNVNAAMVEQGFAVGDAEGRTEWSVMWPRLQEQRRRFSARGAEGNVRVEQKAEQIVQKKHCCFFFSC